MALADMTRSGKAIMVGGQERVMKPLRLQEFGEMERWMQQNHLEQSLKALTQTTGVPNRTVLAEQRYARQQFVAEAHQYAKKLTMMTKEGRGILMSLTGMLYVLYLSFRRSDPELKEAEFYEWWTDLGSIQEAFSTLMEISGFFGGAEDQAERVAKLREQADRVARGELQEEDLEADPTVPS